MVLAGLPLLARLPALLVREMLHPPLCNRRQRVSNRGEHRPSHRHDWRRTVVQIGDAGVKVTIKYECPVAGGERRVYCEQVRTALVVVPALPTAMLRITAFRTIMQTQSSEEPLVGKQRSGLVAPCSGSRHSVPVSSRAIGQAAQWWVVGAVPCCSRRCASTCRPTIKPAPSVRVSREASQQTQTAGSISQSQAPCHHSRAGIRLTCRCCPRSPACRSDCSPRART